MSYLPREPSEQVATKGDIARLDERFDRLEAKFDRMENRFDQRFAQMDARFTQMDQRMDARFAQMDERMDRMQRFYVGTTVWSMTALTGVFSLVVAFFG